MKKLFTKLTALLIAITISSSLMAQTYSGGSGTSGDPYQIADKDDLEFLSENNSEWVSTKYFIQTADIIFQTADFESGGAFYNSGNGFIPIGDYNGQRYYAHYDGNGHTIDGLYINRSSSDMIGFIGCMFGGYIKNLGLTNVNITGKEFVGALIGYNSGSSSPSSNCFSSGTVTGTSSCVGGLAGTLFNCELNSSYSTATVSGTSSVGGLVGNTNSNINNSYNSGNVSGTSSVGGLVGNFSESSINNCYSHGDVTRISGTNTSIGAFCGYATGDMMGGNSYINYCYSTGDVINTGATDKGFVGFSMDVIFTNNFFDSEASNQTSATGATAKTTTQMQTQSTFTNWDFTGSTCGTDYDWEINATDNDGYPHLCWQVFGPTPPSTQATNITFSSVTGSQMEVGWTVGDGSNRAVFIVQASSGTSAPVDNTTYTANTVFGSGTQIGSTGWYCVYNGTGTSVTVTGLSANTDYRVHVCEYNGAAGSELYLTSSSTNNPANQTTASPYYMAKSSGNWSSTSIWYTNSTGGTTPGDYTTAATETPTADNSAGIIINADVDVDADVSIDQATVNTGQSLILNTGATLTIADGDGTDLTVNGTLDMDGGTFTLNGTLSYGSSSALIYSDAAASQTTSDELPTNGCVDLTIDNSNGVSLDAATHISGDLTVNVGTFSIGANNFTVSGTSDINGTIETSTGTYNAVSSFDATGGNVTFTDAGNLNLVGTVTSLGTLTASTGTVTFYGSSAQSFSGTNTFYNLTIANTSATEKVTSSGTLVVNNNLTVNDGIFVSASDYTNVTIATGATLELSGDITVSGNWTNNGTFTSGTYLVDFDGTASSKTITANGSSGAFYDIAFSGMGGEWTLQDNMEVHNEFAVSDGSFISGNNTVTLIGVDASYKATDIAANNTTWTGGTLNIQSDLSQTLPTNEIYSVFQLGRYSVTGTTIFDLLNSGCTIVEDNTIIDSDAKIKLTETATGVNKVYDGSTDATVTLSNNLISGFYDDVTDNYSSAAFADANVGTDKAVSVSGISISGADAYVYQLLSTTTSTTADISTKDVTIDGSREYDATADVASTIFTISGTVGTETLTLTGSGTVADKNIGNDKVVTLGTLALADGTGGGLATNYNLTSGTTDITATDLEVTGLTASNKTYDGNTDVTLGGTATVTPISGDVVTAGGTATGTFADKNAEADKVVTVTGVTISGADAGNYNLLQQTGLTADITAKELTVSGVTDNKIYDANTTGNLDVGSAALVGVVTGDEADVTLNTGSATVSDYTSADVDVYTTNVSGMTISGDKSTNYYLTQPTITDATISQAALTVTANDLSKVTGTTLTFAGTEFTSSGLLSTDNITSVSLASAGAASSATAGAYDVTPSNAQGTGLSNYSITYNNGTLNVANSVYYKTNLAGSWNWSTIANWLVSADGTTAWTTSTAPPNYTNAETITILSGTTVSVETDLSVDQTVIDFGGAISVATGTTLEVIDGSGTDIANSGTLTVNGTINYNDGTYTHNAGASLTYGSASTLEYSGSSAITAGDELISRSIANLEVNNTAGVSLSGDASASGDFTVNTAGAFVAASGTITLNGTSQTLSGDMSFYNLTKSVTTADVLTFGAGNAYAVSGTLTLNGAVGNMLSLRSSTSGAQWNINPSGTRVISYVDVKDSKNTTATDIDATDNCIDSGNNIKWAFPPSITTQAVTGIYATTATGNGNITDLGAPNPTSYGVCWSTNQNPTIADAHSDEGSASVTGAFTTDITGLTNAPQTYYVRAYVTNTSGTYYGNQVSFITIATPLTQATDILFSGILPTQMSIDWTIGSGEKRAVFVTEITNTRALASPEDGTPYNPDTIYGVGDQIGTSGWYCVYNGTGNEVTVTGLTPNTLYKAMVCEYNGPVNGEMYNDTQASNNPKEVTSVPVSDWALYLGILLIGGFIIVRYRRRRYV